MASTRLNMCQCSKFYEEIFYFSDRKKQPKNRKTRLEPEKISSHTMCPKVQLLHSLQVDLLVLSETELSFSFCSGRDNSEPARNRSISRRSPRGTSNLKILVFDKFLPVFNIHLTDRIQNAVRLRDTICCTRRI